MRDNLLKRRVSFAAAAPVDGALELGGKQLRPDA